MRSRLRAGREARHRKGSRWSRTQERNYYDQTAAFTYGHGFGAVLRFSDRLDFTGQFGLRHVSGLQTVDQFVGTGLETVSNDTARLTFPVVVGLRYHFK